ncbi:MAG: beta-ketoacyl-ACP synthase II [Lachnospiraceae bacterium]|nr:beta-ketoacyl-ACP synthase II [Lachnospiraceae bacterium]
MRRVVITGLGAVTPIGNNVEAMWDSVKANKCGIERITHFDPTDWSVTVAGEVKDFNAEEIMSRSEARKMDLFTQYALVAATEAMNDSGIDMEKEQSDRCGVIFSSGIGGLGTIQRECMRGEQKGYERLSPHFIPMSITNMAAGHIAIRFGIHGMCTCVVTACAGGTNAIGDAFRQIKDGYHDIMFCGGSEASITTLGIGGFASMKALSTASDPMRASIPFDKERGGFVMGEGAGVLILEEYEHAKKRGAKIYCELAGYGATCDANHVTAPLADGSMAAACMKKAMEEAQISPEDMDYINAHGTSTVLNDKSETKAVKLAFGEAAKKLAISSTKSMTGHLLGASGAVEAIITTLAVQNDSMPATVNYREYDEECDLDIIPNEMRKATVNYAMSNSLGFGGHNASLVFKKI